jgi:hypothetical protein
MLAEKSNESDVYSRASKFDSRQVNWLPWLKVYVVLLSLSRQAL